MAAYSFDDHVALLEEHLVPPETSAELLLEQAERLFAEEGNTTRARLAFGCARAARARERVEAWLALMRSEGWDDEDDE